jgi:xylulokinase
MADLVLGIDASTTACKVIAFDAAGTAVAEGRAAIRLHNPVADAWQQDPEDWWRALCDAARACMQRIDPRSVRALAIANQRETFAVTDSAGSALHPALVWMDHRCASEVDRAVARLGFDALHELSGKPPCTTPSVYKLMGLLAREPRLRSKLARVLDVHALLVWRLTGQCRTSLAAADPMGLVDMRARSWSQVVCELVDVEVAQLPELVETGSVIGNVSERAARETGLPAGLIVVAGAGDGQAAGLGAGIVAPGTAYLNLGTAVVSGVLSFEYRHARAFRTLYGAAPGSFFLETDLQGGTFTVNWLCQRLLGKTLAIVDELEREAAAIPAGSEGLLLVPDWNGVMYPYWDAGAKGILVGLAGHHGPAHLYRAALEGIALEQRLHTSGVEEVAGAIRELIVMGGGSKSALWCQIVADALDKPIVRAGTTEATALGAAMLAAAAAGVHPSIEAAAAAMSKRGDRFEPGPDREAYRALFESYRHVYPAVRPWLPARRAGF